jgi:hypothetical protein
MTRRIKLIWDFRGPDSEKIADHFTIHLHEALGTDFQNLMGTSNLDSNHSIAFLIVDESEMITYRDRFKPHRGEYYNS